MIWFVAKTVAGAMLKLFLGTAIVFFALELGAPGGAGWEGVNARFWPWLGQLLLGNFGTSRAAAVIGGLLLDRLAVTLPLIVFALVLAGAIGIGLGWLAGRKRGALATLLTGAAKGLTALPDLWVGLLLILTFGAALRWLPTGGFVAWTSSPGMSLVSLLLPALALALPLAGVIASTLRDAMLAAREADYYRAAMARGLNDDEIFRRHALPNIAVRMLDAVGPAIALTVPGAIIVETVFYLPGMGRLLLDGATTGDTAVVEAGLFLLMLGLLVVTTGIRLGRALVDSRLWNKVAA